MFTHMQNFTVCQNKILSDEHFNMSIRRKSQFIPKRKVAGEIGETGVPCLVIIKFELTLTVIIAMLGMFET